MYSAVVRYEVKGTRYETVQQIASGSPTYAEGEHVPVAYDTANPGAGPIVSALEQYFLAALLLIVGLACLGGCVLIVMVFRPAQPSQHAR